MSDKKEETKSKRPRYRELNEKEQESLYQIYFQHKGRIMSTLRDPMCFVNNRDQIAQYRDDYGYKERMDKEILDAMESRRAEMRDCLEEGKEKCIRLAAELIGSKQVSAKDIKTLWEVFKTELGEPTSIRENKNENVNDPSVDQALEGIRQLIKEGQHESQTDGDDVQDRGQTAGNST